MSIPPTIEVVTAESLLAKVQQFHDEKARLVQISATRLPEQVELTYSFEVTAGLKHLRLHVPAEAPRVPSVSSVYWSASLYENELHDLFGLELIGLTLDFKGNFYKTAVKFPFGGMPVKAAKPAAAPAASTTATATAPAQPVTPAIAVSASAVAKN